MVVTRDCPCLALWGGQTGKRFSSEKVGHLPSLADFLLVATVIVTAFSPMNASFLQCWADRARGGDGGAPDGRSYCDNCGKTLSAIDLVPILSWLWNRGRARCCGAPLHPTLLYSELAVLIVTIWGVLSVPWQFALPTALLAGGMQAFLLLRTPAPAAARRFAWFLVIVGTGVTIFMFRDGFFTHALAVALACGLVVLAQKQDKIAPESLLLLIPAGAFLGPFWAILTLFLAVPAAFAFRTLKPLAYPRDRRADVDLDEAVAFGIAAAFWLIWLYAVAV